MLSSLRARLIASYVVVILVCLLVLTAVILVGVSRSVQERLILPRLEDRLSDLRPYILALLERGETPATIARRIQQRTQGQDSRLGRRVLFVNDRQIVADSTGEWSGRRINVSLGQLTKVAQQSASGRLSMPGGDEYLYAAVPLSRDGAGGGLILATVTPVQPWYQVLRNPALKRDRNGLLWISFQVGLAAFAVSVLLAVAIARSIARPLQRVASAAKEVASGNYDLHLDITSPDEVRSLATSFNTMTRAVKASQQAQRDFVTNVSHELKTPLTSIQGFSQAIQDGTASDPEAIQQAAGVIYDEASRMARMVSQLLDLAKIEAGQIVMAREAVDLGAVLESCVEKLTPQAAQGDVSLTFDVSQLPRDVSLTFDVSQLPLGARVTGDGDRLAQVFIVLLDNALKHTPSGGQVSVAAHCPNASQVSVSVSDTGPGIPAEDLSRIFERFYQVDKSRARKRGGAGLGLAIAKEIVTAHGGEIVAESIVGMGSKFTVRLPIVSSFT
jgi:signal transduction histidine kinase